jgi:hypothetical protein
MNLMDLLVLVTHDMDFLTTTLLQIETQFEIQS